MHGVCKAVVSNLRCAGQCANALTTLRACPVGHCDTHYFEATSQGEGMKARLALCQSASSQALASEQYEYVKLPNGADGCPSGSEIPTFEECRQLGPELLGAEVSVCKRRLKDQALTISKASHPIHGLEARPLLDERLRGSTEVLLCERKPA